MSLILYCCVDGSLSLAADDHLVRPPSEGYQVLDNNTDGRTEHQSDELFSLAATGHSVSSDSANSSSECGMYRLVACSALSSRRPGFEPYTLCQVSFLNRKVLRMLSTIIALTFRKPTSKIRLKAVLVVAIGARKSVCSKRYFC